MKIRYIGVHGFIREAKTFWKEVDRANLNKGDLLRFDGGAIKPASLLQGSGKYSLIGALNKSLMFEYEGGDIEIRAETIYTRNLLTGILYYINGKQKGLVVFWPNSLFDNRVKKDEIESLFINFQAERDEHYVKEFDLFEPQQHLEGFDSLRYLVISGVRDCPYVDYKKLYPIIASLEYFGHSNYGYSWIKTDNMKYFRNLKVLEISPFKDNLSVIFSEPVSAQTIYLTGVSKEPISHIELPMKIARNLKVEIGNWKQFKWLCNPHKVYPNIRSLAIDVYRVFDEQLQTELNLLCYPNLENLSLRYCEPNLLNPEKCPLLTISGIEKATKLRTIEYQNWRLPEIIIPSTARRLYLAHCRLDSPLILPEKSELQTLYVTGPYMDFSKLEAIIHTQIGTLVLNQADLPAYGSKSITTICMPNPAIRELSKYPQLRRLVLYDRFRSWKPVESLNNLTVWGYSWEDCRKHPIPDNITFLSMTKSLGFTEILKETYPLLGFYENK